MPNLAACEPVTYDAVNRALVLWLPWCPSVWVALPQLKPVLRSV